MRNPYNLRNSPTTEIDSEYPDEDLDSSDRQSVGSSPGREGGLGNGETDHFPNLRVSFVHLPPHVVHPGEPFSVLIDTRKAKNLFITVQILRGDQQVMMFERPRITEPAVLYDDIKLFAPGMYTLKVYLSKVKKDWEIKGVCDLDPNFEVKAKY